jgi:hypothetical protein
MKALPIPTPDVLRKIDHDLSTEILHAHRRCAPQSELNALYERQQRHMEAGNLLSSGHNTRIKARAILLGSSSPGCPCPDGERYEADRLYRIADEQVVQAYEILGIKTGITLTLQQKADIYDLLDQLAEYTLEGWEESGVCPEETKRWSERLAAAKKLLSV